MPQRMYSAVNQQMRYVKFQKIRGASWQVDLIQTQRRVTFHLPDGSQESCSDSGLGDQEPSSSASTTQPLPLGFTQEEYYEQTSPNSRTEGDGNSDPESSEYCPSHLGSQFCEVEPREGSRPH
ncbi:hypothetical protein AAFF_G00054230 [Aldrovandia affinis]|uniref:Uncharacterized protein n=1 Tax=Aldrovandia affinis TaxID=143900 RepID=A0AAD7WFJ1_9TELE|nr:hypothetical protein AAFF_G00054230 [Aldrovandia affinis]